MCVFCNSFAIGIEGDVTASDEDMEVEIDEIIINDNIPDLYIRAVNPGYTVDGKNNVGEMIELSRKNSDAPISLTGVTVGYTNSSGSDSILFEFPENSWMSGKNVLLRLASSSSDELASVNYSKTLAFKAGLTLLKDDEVIDSVCWTSKDDCYREFRSSLPTTLVRNLMTNEFEHVQEYEPQYEVDSYYVESNGDDVDYAEQCKGLQFSEILSYYETTKSEQFIEFYNPSSSQIILDGCLLRYKNKNYVLSGVIGPEEYSIYYPKEFSLTKNPTNSNYLELVDVNGTVVDELVYSNGQRKGAAYAMIGIDKKGEEVWKVTYALTPGEANHYQEYQTCEEGKVINTMTGNCVKAVEIKEKTCKVGYYLNSDTNRCKKIKTANTKTCKAGYYLNPETNRCRKIKATEKKTCKEGYYLNPETNRCRKIKENKGADYSLKPENYSESSSFIALYAVLGVAMVGISYVVYEFRNEIKRLFGRVFRRSH